MYHCQWRQMGRQYHCAHLSELSLSSMLLLSMLLKVLRNGELVLRRLWPHCAAPGSAQGQPCSCQGASAGRGLCRHRDTVGGAQPAAVTRLHRAAYCCLPRPRRLCCSPPGPSSWHPRCAWLGHIYWLPIEADAGSHLGCDLLVCLPAPRQLQEKMVKMRHSLCAPSGHGSCKPERVLMTKHPALSSAVRGLSIL